MAYFKNRDGVVIELSGWMSEHILCVGYTRREFVVSLDLLNYSLSAIAISARCSSRFFRRLRA